MATDIRQLIFHIIWLHNKIAKNSNTSQTLKWDPLEVT